LVEVEVGTRLAGILGATSLSVNSLHHQGLKDLGAGARPVAHSTDGLVEALEIPSHCFGIGVQWHPECLTDQETMRRLFRAFVEAADE
jgi:putative glutamine amidotransferase